jgi:hypothetical protein
VNRRWSVQCFEHEQNLSATDTVCIITQIFSDQSPYDLPMNQKKDRSHLKGEGLGGEYEPSHRRKGEFHLPSTKKFCTPLMVPLVRIVTLCYGWSVLNGIRRSWRQSPSFPYETTSVPGWIYIHTQSSTETLPETGLHQTPEFTTLPPFCNVWWS